MFAVAPPAVADPASPILLIGVTDVTELIWDIPPEGR
jgi:hypothetical protein